MTEHRDDSEMSRFERHGQRAYSARDAVGAVALVALLLVLFSGGSIRDAAAQIDPGVGHDIVNAVGGPTQWVADRLPLQTRSTSSPAASPPTRSSSAAASTRPPRPAAARPAGIPPITADAFDPAAIGSQPPPSSSCTRCWSPATPSLPRSTPSSPVA